MKFKLKFINKVQYKGIKLYDERTLKKAVCIIYIEL